MMNRTSIILTLCLMCGCAEEPDDPAQAFAEGDYRTAFVLWQPLAEKGDVEAQHRLGMMYYLGYAVQQSNMKAFEWYLRAARAGHPGAQRDLGLMYESGRLGTRDFEQAYLWLFAAYQQGNPNASQALHMIAGQLSPNRVQVLKNEARAYIRNDVIDPEDDDF